MKAFTRPSRVQGAELPRADGAVTAPPPAKPARPARCSDRDREIQDLARAGVPIGQIARRYDLSERRIRQIIRRGRKP